MNIAFEFRNVDILFGCKSAAACRQALALLDGGATRDEIRRKLDVIVGVAGASLSLEQGTISVLMGLSGSGKSTLLRSANGLNSVTRGEVRVYDGPGYVDVAACGKKELRELRRHRLAMVFQQFALLPWRTVRENVGLGLELQHLPAAKRARIVDEKLHLVGLDRWADSLASELSGGMQQRVGLARAFATEADILLMDEPFSALDPLIRAHLQDELLALQKHERKTILFVSHDMDEALKLGNQITIMRDGRIVQSGSREDVIVNPADDYVDSFIRHMNPLSVLQASFAMTAVEKLSAEADGSSCLDKTRTYRLDTRQGAAKQCVRCHQRELQIVAGEGHHGSFPADSVAMVLPTSSLKTVLHLHQITGHPVLVGDGDGVIGVCDDSAILSALAQAKQAAPPRNPAPGAGAPAPQLSHKG